MCLWQPPFLRSFKSRRMWKYLFPLPLASYLPEGSRAGGGQGDRFFLVLIGIRCPISKICAFQWGCFFFFFSFASMCWSKELELEHSSVLFLFVCQHNGNPLQTRDGVWDVGRGVRAWIWQNGSRHASSPACWFDSVLFFFIYCGRLLNVK